MDAILATEQKKQDQNELEKVKQQAMEYLK